MAFDRFLAWSRMEFHSMGLILWITVDVGEVCNRKAYSEAVEAFTAYVCIAVYSLRLGAV